MIHQLWILLDVAIASALSAFVGLERERKNRPAGMRTNMIVGGASCLLVSLTSPLMDFVITHESQEIINTDPIRIIQALVVGIGFIGGGTILKLTNKEKVKGLTTAATMLYTTGLGISVALSQYVIAIGITVMILIVNFLIDKLISKWLDS
jgi:putative Mg2+ transporter-C (MgtC) family protein